MALLISVSAFGQKDTQALLERFLSVDHAPSTYSESFVVFLKNLEKKHSSIKQEDDFVRYLFTKTHQQYLNKYEASAGISNIFQSRSYNCLTGTIVYDLLLNHFQISHQVIETTHHIFILAETKQGQILLEATDPVNGFVNNPLEIESRINTYRANFIPSNSSKSYSYQFNYEVFSPVSMQGLKGLLYYNKAVDAYNHQKIGESVENLKEAHALYSSSRIDEFSQILLITIQQSNLENQLRTEYLKTVLAIKSDLTHVLAMAN